MTRMTEGERSAWIEALALRLRRLAGAARRRGCPRPPPPGRELPRRRAGEGR